MKYKVYIHITPNGKRYVGLTTQPLSRRWRNGQGYAGNKYFTRAILKYGWDNIKHIIYEVDTEAEMFYLEKYLIAYYNTTNPAFGYNISSGGEFSAAGTRWHHTEEHKASIRGVGNPMFGKTHSAEARKKMSDAQPSKSVCQYNLNGNLIKIWKSMAEAGRSLGIFKANISACCKGKAKSAGGFIWKYETYNEVGEYNCKTVLQDNRDSCWRAGSIPYKCWID